MTVSEIYAGGKFFELTGTGFQPTGEIKHNQATVNLDEHKTMKECLITGLLCNDSNRQEGLYCLLALSHLCSSQPGYIYFLSSTQLL